MDDERLARIADALLLALLIGLGTFGLAAALDADSSSPREVDKPVNEQSVVANTGTPEIAIDSPLDAPDVAVDPLLDNPDAAVDPIFGAPDVAIDPLLELPSVAVDPPLGWPSVAVDPPLAG
jgi:hypothetical protein